MTSCDRLTRVNELLKRVLAELIERESGAFSPALVSVTNVKCSPDLRTAVVMVSVFNSTHFGSAIHTLNKMRVELQRKVAAEMPLRCTPVLSFKLDDRISSGDRVLELLNEVREEDETSDR